jgi:mannonate dehydratase
MSFRWFGPDDRVSPENIRQIPGVEGIVSALHDVPAGEVWPRDALERLGDRIAAVGLRFAVA